MRRSHPRVNFAYGLQKSYDCLASSQYLLEGHRHWVFAVNRHLDPETGTLF